MYICLCQGVTDHQIRKAAEDGCRSMRQLGKDLGVGRQCGRCAASAREILRESQNEDYLNLANLLANPA
jgi:bacterioferritin-associated ferredoxin